jgi:hypothetical protein
MCEGETSPRAPSTTLSLLGRRPTHRTQARKSKDEAVSPAATGSTLKLPPSRPLQGSRRSKARSSTIRNHSGKNTVAPRSRLHHQNRIEQLQALPARGRCPNATLPAYGRSGPRVAGIDHRRPHEGRAAVQRTVAAMAGAGRRGMTTTTENATPPRPQRAAADPTTAE